jgi:PPK2 family polyphosphate:nucleotide phosphotransferase
VSQKLRVEGRVRLADFDPAFCGGLDKEEARQLTERNCLRIAELQSRLYANTDRAVLVVLQGMDASGKDGATKKLLEFVNPAGVEVANFKAPSATDLAHDFLWRIHAALPQFGRIGVFNRSHYEDVLIVRVLDLKPKEVWKLRYDQINRFEQNLAEAGYIILKFFLQISLEEQAERLRERLSDKSKNWKFEIADLRMRERWDDFMEAYEDVLNKCSTPWAPWHIVPSDRKWYRDYAISETVKAAMEEMDLRWPKPKEDLSKVRIR